MRIPIELDSTLSRRFSAGFALPTVLLAATIMFSVLLLAIQANTAVRAELNAQYYNQQARLASQSGVVRAQQCLNENGSVATWTDAKPLTPSTDCSGNVVAGYPSYVVSTSSLRTTFTVPAPIIANGTQRITVNGKLELLRTSSNTPWRTYDQALVAQIGADVSFGNVTFGYVGGGGSFFGTIGLNGEVKAVGYNADGQLGTGNTINSTTPKTFQLPPGTKASRLFTSFLSGGNNMFAIDGQGNVYGAGLNTGGQLGNGTTTSPVTVPTKFILPVGVKARFVGLGIATFVIGDDYNIYASGMCSNGILGSNYTISGCTNKSSYVRVNLPAPDTSDLNTLPVANSPGVPDDNLVVDRFNAFVRMQGGRVYGWGINDVASLGTGDNTSSSTPVKVGTFGDAGQPKATQLAYDGETLYVLDDTGTAYAVGNGQYGSLGGAPRMVQNRTSGKCMDNAYNSTSAQQASLYDCLDSVPQQMTFNPIYPGNSYGTISTSPNSSTTLCLDNYNGGTADNNPVYWWPCNGNLNQMWVMWDDGHIQNQGSGKCLNNANSNMANFAPLGIWTCLNHTDQQWNLLQSKKVTKVPVPASSGAVQQIVTDQWSVLFRTANGDVWGAGGNDRGQLCNGTVGKYISAALTKVTLPPGRTATFIYTTKVGAQGADYANTYIIMDDGSVYGCGANTFGQLGNGTTSASTGTPVKMNLPADAIAKMVQTGYGTTVVLTSSGRIYTVGNNANGQLGDGTTTNSSTPKANKYTNVIPPVLY